MNLLEKYLQGDTLHIYDEIERMGSDAFIKDNLREIKAVLKETMVRVRYNLDVIYASLQEADYCFTKSPRQDFEYPLLKPRWGTRLRISRLDKIVRPFGHIPLSLKMFYQIVGSCNFAWDYDAVPDIPWEGTDPIQIGPITSLLTEAKELEPDEEPIGLPVSADYYHKDNISGGPPYSVELTAWPQVDSRFLNEEHHTTFINYLRITFDNCGFSRAGVAAHLPDFMDYLLKVKPLLKPI